MKQALNKIRELQSISGMNNKVEFIAQNRDDTIFVRLLYYACHPRKTYKVSEATLNQVCMTPSDTTYPTIFAVCEDLQRVRAVRNEMVQSVLAFLYRADADDRALYVKLLAKNLRLGVTAKNINRAIPGLIEEWEVQQAYPIDTNPLKDGVWFSVSQKLNGVRATVCDGNIIGRNGTLLSGLDHILEELANYPNYVFDGELTLQNAAGMSDNSAFRAATGIINSDLQNKTTIQFTIFDVIERSEFANVQGTTPYSERRKTMDVLAAELCNCKYVSILPVLYSGTDQGMIEPLLDKMVSEDKEGLMVNLDVPYKRKRHNGILKVKRFYTMDLPIIRCEEGTNKLKNNLGALIVDFDGTEVGVGSGFTDEQRSYLWAIRDDLAGTLVEVKYKEISQDKKTKKRSLQFPVFLGLRTDKQEISYG